MATALELQQAINRFANDPFVGFSPIVCDGDPGTKTLAAAILALNAIDLSDPGGPDSERVSGANVFLGTLDAFKKPSEIKQWATQLVSLLSASADAMGYGPGVCAVPGTKSSSTAVPRTPQAKQVADKAKQTNKALSAGILGLGLPDWAVYTGGAALLIAVAMLIKNKKAAVAPGKAIAGRRYR